MHEQPVEVVRFFTATKRIPFVIGKLTDGLRLPFGPYTGLQLVAAIMGFVVARATLGWVPFNNELFRVLLTIVVAIGAAVAAGYLPRSVRNPLLLAIDYVRAVFAPRSGRIGGSRPAVVRGHWTGRNSARDIALARAAVGWVPAVRAATAEAAVPVKVEPVSVPLVREQGPTKADAIQPAPLAVSAADRLRQLVGQHAQEN